MLAALMVFTGCKQLNKGVDNHTGNDPDSGVETETILEIDCSEIELDYAAQSVEIAVVANRTFEVDICVDWISYTIAESGDCVTLHVAENTELEPRSAEIVILAGELLRSVTIYQSTKPELMVLSLEHSSAHLDSPKWGGDEVKGSVDWGDGTTEEYYDGISHDYGDAQKRSAQFTMEGTASFRIESIGDIESVILAL